MGSNSKRYNKDKESNRKRRHSEERDGSSAKEKRHKHKRHHRDKRREKPLKNEHDTDGSDVEIISDDQQDEGGGAVESLSIEESNKLRAKLGLKPLEIAKKNDDNKKRDDGKKKDDWGEFYHKPAENWADKNEREKIKNKLATHKEKRQLENKLNRVKPLGESDSDDNVDDWVEKSRQIENAKKEAEKRAKMLEELDEQFGVTEIINTDRKERRAKQYTEKHLKGLTVEHSIDSFAEERDVILTLKDNEVLSENQEDILINPKMLDDEKYHKNLENKKKKILYNAYEDQEYDKDGNPKEKSLLAQYDEEIHGQKKDSFRIGLEKQPGHQNKTNLLQDIKEKLAKKRLETIETRELKIASEYYNEEELAKFKKPKKKVRKLRKVASELDDIPKTEIDLDIKPDDDLLEKALNKARKMKQKEMLITDLIKEEPLPEDESSEPSNIILNSTAEFCRTLGDIPTYGKSGNREESDDIVDFDRDLITDDYNESHDSTNEEEKSGWSAVDPNEVHKTADFNTQEVQILDEEPDVSTGAGAALKLAMSKGYLDKGQKKRPSNTRLADLQAKHYSIEDKTYGDETERGQRRERYTGPIMDFKEKDNFKPNVKLEYIDDDGHVLNSKEAFRYLSHKFHGKGPGKNKVEKRLKKSAQEQLMKKMSSTDTPLGTLNMLQAKQKETQSAYVVLSGNKQNQTTVISKSRR